MSNPTEQPIDPGRLVIWCDVCQIEVTCYDDWQAHLDSKRHNSELKL